MRWAFWRRRRRPDAVPEPAAPPAAGARPAPRDDPQDPPQRAAAFSGAQPDPRGPAAPAVGAAAPAGPGGAALGDLRAVRGDVVALVRAVLDGDDPAVQEVLARLDGTGGTDLAVVAALAGLGDRLVTAAGFPAGAAPPGSSSGEAVVAQGDTTARRADALLRRSAPHVTDDLVRLVVRFSCGDPDADPAVAHLVDAPARDLVLVAAVLLAQDVRDGGGDVDALAAELAELLPDV